MFNIIGKRYWFFLLSAIVIVPGTISLIVFGLNPSPDFVGGSEIEVQVPKMATTQTGPLGSILQSSTKTSALPAGRILKIGTGGTVFTIRAPLNSASDQINLAVQKATGKTPLAGITLTSTAATCAPNCSYTAAVSSTLSKTSPAYAKLQSALAKDYPAKGKTPGATVTSLANGSSVLVQVPVSGLAGITGPLFNVVNGFAAPASGVVSLSTGACPPDCRYRAFTTTAIPAGQVGAFRSEFAKVFPKIKASAGIAPQSVDTVIGSVCKETCYDIRSSFLNAAQVQSFTTAVKTHYGLAKNVNPIISATSVGGTVAASTKQNAIIAVAVAALFILAYITFAFRKMPHPVRYGTAAIIAMLHDVLVVVGIFSILGKVLHMEVDATFVTALLTIIGFSVHDTIVIFDRIRENVTRRTGEAFEKVVNHSVLQSFVRSINTSFTVVLTLGAIFLFTGEQIRTFVLAMLIGIISGTYSSIFNASPILVVWQTGELRRIFSGRRPTSEDTTTAPTTRIRQAVTS